MLSPYSSPAKTQQAQIAIDLSLCYATLTNSLKDSYSIVLPPLWMSTSSLSRRVSALESPALVNFGTSRSSLKMAGYEEGLITGAAFVDLSAAYDTVNHRILTRKLCEITQDVRLTELIQNMLSNRRFFVDLVGKRSRWRRQKNGLPQGSVLAPLLFNIYTNDQPVHPNTRSFLYADDMCIATQKQSFEEVEKTLGDALAGLTPYYAANHLRANPDKTQISTFHLKNRDAQRELKVVWHGEILAYSHKPAYLGVPLDRCLTYKDNIAKTKAKTGARNSILNKLAYTNWEQTPELSAPQPWLCVSPLLSTRPQYGADHRMLQRSIQF